MKRTDVNGQSVILVAGMIQAAGGQIFGMFDTEDAARSDQDADARALGTVGAESLTPKQIEIAEANSAELDTITTPRRKRHDQLTGEKR